MDKMATVSQPDYAGAIAHALQRLRSELPNRLSYHNVEHTESDVLPAVQRLAEMSGLADEDTQLIKVAAAFHDIGQIRISKGHESLGVGIINKVLPRFGFDNPRIDRVAGMILATRLPQSPRNEEQAILCDADLDSLGRDDFLETSTALWQEFAAAGVEIPWGKWLENQLDFLRTHRYFTAAAYQLRKPGKLKNIALLEQLIQNEQTSGQISS
jgi:uncharacterized protein